MELWAVKVIILFLILFLTLLFGLVSIKTVSSLPGKSGTQTRKWRGKFILSLLNCFGGGVFLATTFIDLLPEVRESIENVLDAAKIETPFAMSELLVCLGFFMIMVFEHLTLTCKQKSKKRKVYAAQTRNETGSDQDDLKSDNTFGVNPPQKGQYGSVVTYFPSGLTPDEVSNEKEPYIQFVQSQEEKQPDFESSDQLQGTRTFVLFLAISIHTLFDGLTIGLQSTEAATWTLFTAIAIHKCIITFSLGIQLAETTARKSKAVLFIVLYSLVTPTGLIIGGVIAINAEAEPSGGWSAVSAILQALATGIFFYVTFFEVLQKEIGHEHNLTKVFVVIVGFALLTLLLFFNGEEQPNETGHLSLEVTTINM